MVCRDSTDNMFVSLVLGLLDTAERQLTFCNAGHVPPLFKLADGPIQTLDAGGCLLGVIPEEAFEQERIELPPDSVLLMYSDGVTDTMNEHNECYGVQRLADLLATLRNQPAENICRRIDESALDFSKGAEPFDDFTLLALRSL
jgi:sigma-B regulation protein RsbU (phosphoserine phosphatase)